MRYMSAIAILPLLGGIGLSSPGGSEWALRGEVVSAKDGSPVAGAWIAPAGSLSGTYSWNDGHFYLPGASPVAEAYEIHALGYRTATVSLSPGFGPTEVALEPDVELLAAIDSVMERLAARRHWSWTFDREALAFSGAFSLGDLLARHGLTYTSICIDDRTAPGAELLEPHELYFMEVAGRQIRLYTESFIERAARGEVGIPRYWTGHC